MRFALALACALTLLGAPAHAQDPRWEFYSSDQTQYASPWYAGKHRVMIPFGCTHAPYYEPDPRCDHGRGFHHGIDIAIPCGTRLLAGRNAWVASHGSLGPAYGVNPILLRNYDQNWDLVIGHTITVYVDPGDRVRKGQLIARVGDSAAPDGCHLHFEKRTLEGSLEDARPPRGLLDPG